MSHIEFTGPPGSGKTTIYNKLLKRNDNLISPKSTDVLAQHISSNSKFKTAACCAPEPVRSFFLNNFWGPKARQSLFERFVASQETYLSLIDEARLAVNVNSNEIYPAFWRSGWRYQLGVETVTNDETITLDQGFCHRAVSISWRANAVQPPITDFYQRIPLPDYLIYVDAPVKICLERQHNRNAVVVRKDWIDDQVTAQRTLSELCSQVATDAENHGVEVINVSNVATIHDAVTSVEDLL